MAGVREALAVVLGVALGVVFLAAPEFVARVYTVGRLPTGRRGPYGEDSETALPPPWRRLIQVVGALFVLGAAFIGARAVDLL